MRERERKRIIVGISKFDHVKLSGIVNIWTLLTYDCVGDHLNNLIKFQIVIYITPSVCVYIALIQWLIILKTSLK